MNGGYLRKTVNINVPARAAYLTFCSVIIQRIKKYIHPKTEPESWREASVFIYLKTEHLKNSINKWKTQKIILILFK